MASARYSSIPMMVTVPLCPILGTISDKFGKKSIFLLASAIIYTISFSLWLILPDCNDGDNCNKINFLIPLILNGIALATYFSVVFAVVTMLVDKKLLGTAFGMLDCF